MEDGAMCKCGAEAKDGMCQGECKMPVDECTCEKMDEGTEEAM